MLSFNSHVVTHSAFEQSTNMNENINDHIERCIVHKLQNLIVINMFSFFLSFLELVISIWIISHEVVNPAIMITVFVVISQFAVFDEPL